NEFELLQEVGWQGYSQRALRRGLAVLGQRAGGLGLLEQAPRMLEHAFAELGDRELASGAGEQPFAETALERADPPGDGRFRQAAALGGLREAAGIDHAGEEDQVVGCDVHVSALHAYC